MSATELLQSQVARAEENVDFLRLASCPRCESRRRALVEVGNEIRGRCLACGEEIAVPLAVEHHGRIQVVGRAAHGRYTDD